MLENLRLFYLEKGLAFYFILDFSFDGNQLTKYLLSVPGQFLRLIKLFDLIAMSNVLLPFGKLGPLNNLLLVFSNRQLGTAVTSFSKSFHETKNSFVCAKIKPVKKTHCRIGVYVNMSKLIYI